MKKGEVHVWVLPFNRVGEIYENCEVVLTDGQLKKRDFLAFEQDKVAHVISQGGLCLLLAAYLKIPAEDIDLGREAKGKPFSLDNPSLQFNLSNSGEICTIAFGLDYPIGVDIEKVRKITDLETLISSNFTHGEIADIRRSSDTLTRFFQYWTMKESYLKAIGEGMRLTPNNLEFALDSVGVKLLSVNGVPDGDYWQFQLFKPAKAYVGTLSMSSEVKKVKIYRVE